MASIGRWSSPLSTAVGGCVSVDLDAWLETTYPCLEKLRIAIAGYGLSAVMVVNFAGRGKVGGACIGSDSYVSFAGGALTIDVWQALIDGVWTSSTTVLVYVAFSGVPFAPQVSAYAGPSALNGVVKSPTSHDAGGVCPTTLQATVTINDDGSISIA